MTSARRDLLAAALPDADRTLLLRALTATGDAARHAWDGWRRVHPSLLDALTAERTDALAALLPLLRAAADQHGFDLSPAEWTRVRTAAFREELRADAYAAVFAHAIDALDARSIACLVLAGRPLAELLYEAPCLHHTGAIDLLVHPGESDAAAAVLFGAGFGDLGRIGDASWTRRRLRHESGLGVTIGETVLAHPFYVLDSAAAWAASQTLTAAGRRVGVAALHDQLALLCARGAWTGSRASMLWLMDAFLLCRRRDMDWRAFVLRVREGRAALPAAAVLGYLHSHLQASVPEHVLVEVREAAAEAGPVELEVAMACLAAATETSIGIMLEAARGGGRWAILARWALHPSAVVREWETGRCEAAPALSLRRPLAFMARRIRALPASPAATANR